MEPILKHYLTMTQNLSLKSREQCGKMNLTVPQVLSLSVLADGPLPISKLAEKTGSANSTISGVVDRLEQMGLARRIRSAEDRRVITVEATEAFFAMWEKTQTFASEYFTSLLHQLTPQEQETVLQGFALMDKVLTAQKQAES